MGKDRVRKFMHQHAINSRTKRKFVVTPDSGHSLPVAPDLLQQRFKPEKSNQLWSDDITYIQAKGWRRRPPPGLIFHSDRDSQCCSAEFPQALKN